jgi:hypothetical protein
MKISYGVIIFYLFLTSANLHAQTISNFNKSKFNAVDSLKIENNDYYTRLYVYFPHIESDSLFSLIALQSKDTTVYYRNIITCEECIGRGTRGSTYSGASTNGKYIIINQNLFDRDIKIYVSIIKKNPSYLKIIVSDKNKKAGKTYLPKQEIKLSDFSFMDKDLNDPEVLSLFKIRKR